MCLSCSLLTRRGGAFQNGRGADNNYPHVLARLSLKCENQNIASLVIPTFIARLTEVAALAHSQEKTFAAKWPDSSSFHPRNVTYEGTVLDLDTYGPWSEAWKLMLKWDYTEMVECSQLLQRMIGRVPAYDTAAQVRKSYIAQLEIIKTDPRLLSRIVDNLPDNEDIY